MNTSRTLEQLEGTSWPPAPADSTQMVFRCYELRKVPIAKLLAGDCRVLINQGIGVKYLVPIALGFLEESPLIEGDYYPGDLLVAMTRIENAFWLSYPDELKRFVAIVNRAAEEVSNATSFNSDRQLRKDIDAFLERQNA